ncbi:MarR family transcriptional regulator [Pseudonocardiaceae bacterium YIM PH 21723]|nr:MarR family transcriptional regulator [Pseudonocardiaceae bacterium YIM PH 21723]
MQQLKALLVITTRHGATGQELAASFGVSLATVTGIVDRLVAQGLVERHEDQRDRRVRRLTPTDSGVRLIEKLRDANSAGMRQLLEHLDGEELAALSALILRLTDIAQGLEI